MARPRLSVCIITYNLASFLPHVLANVEALADEIVVIDSHSTDGTAELLARHPKVRLTQRPFCGSFGAQKNAVFAEARGDWILNLDQDELLGDQLRADIPRLIETTRLTHYKLQRYWLLSGPPWRFVDSDMHSPDWCLRLFRNLPQFRFAADQIVHHHFPREGRGPGKKHRRGHIFHFDFILRDRSKRVEKVNFYRGLDARAAPTHQMELYEEMDFRCRPCREPLSGLPADWEQRAKGGAAP